MHSEEVDSLVEDTFKRDVRAKYKIEIFFIPKMQTEIEYVGVIQGWYTQGNADNSLYFCPRCGGILREDAFGELYVTDDNRPHAGYYGAVCHGCGGRFPGEEVLAMFRGKHTIDRWVDILERYYHMFNGDVDFYLKRNKRRFLPEYYRHDSNPIEKNALRVVKTVVDKDRLLLPLKEIVKVTATGREIRSLIRGLITA